MDTAEDPRVRTVTLQGRAILPDLTLTIRQEAILLALEDTHLDLEVILQAPEVTHQDLPLDQEAILHHQDQEAIPLPQDLEVILLQLEAILNHLDLVVILLHPLEAQEATHTHPHPMLTQVLHLLVLQAVLILD